MCFETYDLISTGWCSFEFLLGDDDADENERWTSLTMMTGMSGKGRNGSENTLSSGL